MILELSMVTLMQTARVGGAPTMSRPSVSRPAASAPRPSTSAPKPQASKPQPAKPQSKPAPKSSTTKSTPKRVLPKHTYHDREYTDVSARYQNHTGLWVAYWLIFMNQDTKKEELACFDEDHFRIDCEDEATYKHRERRKA